MMSEAWTGHSHPRKAEEGASARRRGRGRRPQAPSCDVDGNVSNYLRIGLFRMGRRGRCRTRLR